MLKNNAEILTVPFTEALQERYLAYALSTIMSRSLPDLRDGLKPVHRRLLFSMYELKLDPKSAFKKCARIVGDVMGKYHPHGEVALYDTLVRLAQDFTLRYPLIEGQGNFGSIDGDNAAAMRYTESKLTPIATLLLDDLDQETVEFKPNYDGQDVEPMVLPAAFPNLLANGCEGIAVGMATYIPPHNLDELILAMEKLVANPDTPIEELLDVIQGPDFPTGGVILEEKEAIIQAYKTGRGSFRLRGKWHKEMIDHGTYRIIITEVPYQVQKSKLIEKIADLIRNKKLPLIYDINDESDERIRISIEPKSRNVDPEILMESLFKNSDLEVRIPLNLNVLNKDLVPSVINLKEALLSFIEFRDEVILKRSQYRLGKINHRLEILEGFLIAYLNLDEIIRIIREEDEVKQVLMDKFLLTDIQAEAILNMRLKSLRKLEETLIRDEHKALSKEKKELENIIKNDKVRQKVMLNEWAEIRQKFGINTELGARRTEILFRTPMDIAKVDIQAFVEKEPITVVCSQMGWIKSYKGHEEKEVKYKEGDDELFVLKTYTTDQIIIFTNFGKSYSLLADNIPKTKAFGDSIKLLFEFSDNEQPINIFIYKPEQKLLLISNIGKGFVIDSNDVLASTKMGKKIFNVADKIEVQFCLTINGDHLALIGSNRRLLILPIADIPSLKRGQGVTLQKYKQASLSDAQIFKTEEGFTWRSSKAVKKETNLINWLGKRGGSGKMPPIGFSRDNKF